MARILIKNISSIVKEISFDIRQVNVFAGPNSYIITRILSQVFQAERRYLASGVESDLYNCLLLAELDKGYFTHPDFGVTYESDWCSITLSGIQTKYQRKVGITSSEIPKSVYIPAYRNLVCMPGIGGTTDFHKEWSMARSIYQKFDLSLPDLEISYLNNGGQDYVLLGGTEVSLGSISNGYKSVLPLLLVYNGSIRCSKSINLIIEEPEQGLYPSTQRGLLKHLVSQVRSGDTLTFTTHSPYILNCLNNSLIAGSIGKEQNITPGIDPQKVGMWALLLDGSLNSLQDKTSGLLIGDEFNKEFQKSHSEMFQLLKQK